VKLRSRVTIVLILINVAVYIFMEVHGGASESNPYYMAGVLDGPDVRAGEWYRIVTGAFMHEGIPHIAINMFSLYQLGSFVETMLGGWRMLLVYAISLVGSGLAVVYFSNPNDVTVGASGAIFGLFGALFAIGVRMGKPGRALISQTLPILVLNLVFTFAVPFISKAAHVGGLLSGFAAGLVIYAIRRRPVAATVTDAVTGESTEAELLPPVHDEAGAPQTHA
jgi:membrane associated rhomboid family serine protease